MHVEIAASNGTNGHIYSRDFSFDFEKETLTEKVTKQMDPRNPPASVYRSAANWFRVVQIGHLALADWAKSAV